MQHGIKADSKVVQVGKDQEKAQSEKDSHSKDWYCQAFTSVRDMDSIPTLHKSLLNHFHSRVVEKLKTRLFIEVLKLTCIRCYR